MLTCKIKRPSKKICKTCSFLCGGCRIKFWYEFQAFLTLPFTEKVIVATGLPGEETTLCALNFTGIQLIFKMYVFGQSFFLIPLKNIC